MTMQAEIVTNDPAVVLRFFNEYLARQEADQDPIHMVLRRRGDSFELNVTSVPEGTGITS